MEHFGVKLRITNKSLHISREEFATINTKASLPKFPSLEKRAAYANPEGTEYTREWCEEYRLLCLQNFDLNMQYFSRINTDDFNEALNKYLRTHRQFKTVTNLEDYAHIEGYYIMVLDQYKQVYIGKSTDIKRRIRQHWSTTKPFDRTLLPMYAVQTSVFSIDFFRALDTTRIFAWKRKLSFSIEAQLIEDFPKEYSLNRIGGDITVSYTHRAKGRVCGRGGHPRDPAAAGDGTGRVGDSAPGFGPFDQRPAVKRRERSFLWII